MDALLQWGHDGGAAFKVAPDPQRHPRKLYATSDLSPGDVVFSIPSELLLYGARAFEDAEYGAAFRQLHVELGGSTVLDQRCLLVLLLVLERCKGSTSAFAPYIDMLPTSYDNPFWWSAAELQLLQGTRLLMAVQHYMTGMQQLHSWLLRLEQIHTQHLQHQHQHQHHQQQQHIQPGHQQPVGQEQGGEKTGGILSTALGGWGLTFEAVKWARSAVWSRAFTINGLAVPPPPLCGSIGTAAVASTGGSNGAAGGSNGLSGGSSGQLCSDQGEVEPMAEDLSCQQDGSTAGAAAAAAGSGDAANMPVVALVPMLDMCDHHPDQRVVWRVVTEPGQQQQQQQKQLQEQEAELHTEVCQQAPPPPPPPPQQQQQQPQQVFQFTTLKPVDKGAELFNNYGTIKPNQELLLGYGFVLEANPNDSFLVSISNRAGAGGTTAAAAAGVAGAGCSVEHTQPAAAAAASSAETAAQPGDVSGRNDDETGGSEAEAQCHDTAVWQQRLAALAAAGLALEVPISSSRPLPSGLLDMLLLAAAMPTWRLPQVLADLSGQQQCKKPGSCASSAAMSKPGQQQLVYQQGHLRQAQATQQQEGMAAQSVQQQTSFFEAAPLSVQLEVLQQVVQQLGAKLARMLPRQQLVNHLLPHQTTSPSLPASQQQLPIDKEAQKAQLHEVAAGGSNANGGISGGNGGGNGSSSIDPNRARMAAVYVLSQQEILQGALQAAKTQVYRCLHRAAAGQTVAPAALPAAAAATNLQPSVAAGAAAANSSAIVAGAGADDMDCTPVAAVGAGCNASSIRSKSCNSTWLHAGLEQCSSCAGLSVGAADIPDGSLLMQAPLQDCLYASTEQGLMLQLMLAAAAAGGLVPQQQQQQQQEGAAMYFARQYQRQYSREGSTAGGGGLVPWWLLSQHRHLVMLLQETPAGQQLLQASEWLQDECQAFLQGISAAAAAAGTGDPGSNADAAAAGGGGGNSSGSSGNSSAAAAALLQVVQHHGAHIPALFGWASRLVQQAAMRLSMPGAAAVAAGDAAAEAAAAVTAMDDGGARAADKQAAQQVKQMVVLIPGLEAVPNVLRTLLLQVDICQGGLVLGQGTQQQSQPQPQPQPQQQLLQGAAAIATGGGWCVSVSSKCSIPTGLVLNRSLCSDDLNAQEMLIVRGPAQLWALAQHQPLLTAVSGAGQSHCSRGGSSGGGTSGGCGSSSSGSSVTRRMDQELVHAYDLMAVPPVEDLLRSTKLQLLAATGVGICHRLLDLSDPSAAPMQQQPAAQAGQRLACGSSTQAGSEAGTAGMGSAGAAPAAAAAAAGSNAAPTAGQLPQQQQQQQQWRRQLLVDAVLLAMSACIASADKLVQMLQPDTISAVAREQRLAQQACGVFGAAAAVAASQPVAAVVAGTSGVACVSATAAMLPMAAGNDGVDTPTAAVEHGGEMAAAAAAATTEAGNPKQQMMQAAAAGHEGREGGSDCPTRHHLQQELLRQCGRSAAKQLLQVLKEDLKSVKSAHKQLQKQMASMQPSSTSQPAAVGQEQEQEQKAQQEGQQERVSVSSACCSCQEASGDVSAAAKGVGVYLQGLQALLQSWCQALQKHSGHGSSGGNSGSKRRTSGKGGSKDNSKKARTTD